VTQAGDAGPADAAVETPGFVTRWIRIRDTPLRTYLRTETGSATVLLLAALAALAWANVDDSSYEAFRTTTVSLRVGDHVIAEPLVTWVNSGLMTFFFFVVGLEARREFDLGELRERRRAALPVLSGLAGMAGGVALYLALNAGHSSAGGWGVAMSTDTAFALALLAVAGPRFPQRLRGFLLTLVIVDDIVALIVIATVYADDVQLRPLVTALVLYGLVLACVLAGIRRGLVYLVLGVATWLALHDSGVDPLVLGLAMGVLPYASAGDPAELERVSALFRRFREEPTPELARTAGTQVNWAVSPNTRLAALLHPWTSYVIAPLFALVNAGIVIDGEALRQAAGSRITIGIVLGYVVGKPVGILVTSWLVTRLSRRRLRSPVGWAATLGAGTSAGVGFTVALLITSLAFRGQQREEATIGILAAATLASLITVGVFAATRLLPDRTRARALLGTSEPVLDLLDPPDPERDHVRGPENAPVTLVEYGDFECPHCGRAEPAVRQLLEGRSDIRYIWRHLPLTDVHPHAQIAAEAAEAADRQGAFWEMHDRLLQRQDELKPAQLVRHAKELGLDVNRFSDDLMSRAGAARVAQDVEQAAASGVVGTPTFFVNGRRHVGAYDFASLSDEVKAALARTVATQPR
jgi:Na+/H+ antiporter NhaA